MMISIAGVLAVALAGWAIFRNRARAQVAPKRSAPAQRSAVERSSATPTPASGSATPAVAAAPVAVPPPALAAFEWRQVQDLEGAQRETLLEAIKGIPRPPQSLQKLLSPEFVARAGSAELSELVMGEPIIAAKVLSTVNAPFYGLHKPVTGIGHSVTFLGMNTVRNICVQYMLAEAFKPRLATSQRAFEGIWRASAIASELCVRLSKALNLPDQGALSTQVVLGFVGHLSAASLLPPKALNDWLELGRLERAQREQVAMSLSAGEVGSLLMQAWGLPEALVNHVRAIDRVLVTPPSAEPTAESPRLALCYLCARLGERLATGQMTTLQGYDPFLDVGPDTFYLNQHLRNPMLRQLPAALASAEVQEALAQMMGGAAKTA
ncbi:HDOD domain-containing protein [Hydrogenophaga sp. PAMC20947]|uniref:HDOD domain-containing protein n=1 Tax=Hydrogenophaga sp. PAMC20947 TaxID=2565558 RepID=UPI001FF9BE05|nr:HDOD domain-containing protein [Hydrogenophaga sp. PAMC20947]